MLTKSRHLQMALACVFLSLSFTAVARADPIVFPEFTLNFDFQPLNAVASFSGQAVAASSTSPFAVGNGNWTISGTVTLVDDPILGDLVFLSGGVLEHTNNMPDPVPHGLANPFEFSVLLRPGVIQFAHNGLVQDHFPHFDLFRLEAAVGSIGNQITNWNIVVTGEHVVPEPATMLLLGTGLAGVAIKTRKKLKSRKSRQGTR